MNNAELFKKVFGIYAEEFWSYTEKQMLDWINADVPERNVGDMISRQSVLDAIYEIESEVTDGYGFQYEKWRQYFCELPSAQPEIIRCKDCKHHHRDNSGLYYCERKEYGYGWGLNDFCSDAERRTDE